MPEPIPPALVRRLDGSTPLALAAGLAVGHLVVAMAESGVERTLALPSAVVFVLASGAAVVCSLLATRAAMPRSAAAANVRRWVGAFGAGLLAAALAPGLL